MVKEKQLNNIACRKHRHGEEHDFEPPVLVFSLTDVERVEDIARE